MNKFLETKGTSTPIDDPQRLKDIDIYKAMKEKTGVASHATGGRVSLSAGGLAGMLGE